MSSYENDIAIIAALLRIVLDALTRVSLLVQRQTLVYVPNSSSGLDTANHTRSSIDRYNWQANLEFRLVNHFVQSRIFLLVHFIVIYKWIG